MNDPQGASWFTLEGVSLNPTRNEALSKIANISFLIEETLVNAEVSCTSPRSVFYWPENLILLTNKLKFILEKQLLHVLQGCAYTVWIFPLHFVMADYCYSGCQKTLYDQNNLNATCYDCYSGCPKTLFDQNNQNDRLNSKANKCDPVRYVIVVSLDCTLVYQSVETKSGL